MSSTRDTVADYIADGRVCLPVKPEEKATRLAKWSEPSTRPGPEAFDDDSNIAWRLDDLIDIDLDSPEARAMAPDLLLTSECTHGRPSFAQPGEAVGITHCWFLPSEPVKAEQFKDIDGTVLVEIRTGSQQYTLVPPSVVRTKEERVEDRRPETLAWGRHGKPNPVDGKGARRSAVLLAIGALLGRHWPKGSRHKVALDVAGLLASKDVTRAETERIVKAVCKWAKDDEPADRLKAVENTYAEFKAGKKTSGGPTLEASLGKPVVDLIRKWLGGHSALLDRVVEDMNAIHFVVRLGKDEVIATDDGDQIVFQDQASLHLRYAPDKVLVGHKGKDQTPVTRNKFEVWREHPKRRQYRRLTFAPPPQVAHPEDFNLWKGFAVEPRPGDCSKFLDHVKRNICNGNEEHYTYLIKWMAFTVQFPGIPIEVAIVLKGPLGTGKGIFARNFGALFGDHYVQLDRAEHLTGKFNSSISGKVLVFADEAFFAGDKKGLGTLKRITTEPTLQIERKGIDSVRERNFMHLITATNDAWVVDAAFMERRFMTILVAEAMAQNHEYFGAIQDEMDHGGREALLYYLLNIQVTHTEIRKLPRTAELRVQQEQSMAPHLQWWHECLALGEVNEVDGGWPEAIPTSVLFAAYLRWCDRMKIHKQRITLIDFSRRALKPWLGESFLCKSGEDRDKRFRPLLPLTQARAMFDQQAGTRGQWDEGEPVQAPLPEGTGEGDGGDGA